MSDPRNNKIRHRASTVVIHDGRLLTVEAIDPSSGTYYLFVPGGKVEDTEVPAECAIRETLEETGYEICLTAQNPIESYYEFPWDGQINFCHTIFFAARLINPKKAPILVKDAEYIKGTKWIPVKQIAEHFAYNQAILEAIQNLTQN